jgi:hypothetical protein
MLSSMTDQPPSDVLGALPHTRPHRRSQKRPARPTAAAQAPATERPKPAAGKPVRSAKSARAAKPRAKPLPQPAQPAGGPPTPRTRKPAPATGADILGTTIQAAAELAEIGLSISARALRSAVSRLPRP